MKRQILFIFLFFALGAVAGIGQTWQRTNNAPTRGSVIDESAFEPEHVTEEAEAEEQKEEYLELYSYEAEATVTAAGVNPGTLVVKPGTKVFWVSGDGSDHSLKLTPESPIVNYFDGPQPVTLQKPFSAKFAERGVFTYVSTDHPGVKATVIVTD